MSNHKKKIFIIFNVVIIAIVFFSISFMVSAGIAEETGLKTAAGEAQLRQIELAELIGKIIKYALQLVGIMLVILIIYSGFMWMMASGNTERIKKAQGILKNAFLGLIIIVSAYAIASYVIEKLGAL